MWQTTAFVDAAVLRDTWQSIPSSATHYIFLSPLASSSAGPGSLPGGWLRFLSWKDLSSWLSYSSQAILLLLSICYYNWLDNYQGEPQRSSWLPNNSLLCSHCVTTTQLSSDDYGKLPLHKWLCLSLTVDLLVQKVQSAWVAAVTLNLMRFLQYSWWKYLCSWKQIL